MTPSRSAPVVSVVMSTYNRSAVLRHAIASVRRSTLVEWELIVVGDACTDDTAACVASFGDSRIRFVNLSRRCGDQSRPNSHGVGLARGRYVAFLNHDDLYFPDHLATCVAALESSAADLVWVPCARLLTERERTSLGRFQLAGVPDAPRYSPTAAYYFASSWVFRRAWAEKMGPWSPPHDSYVAPSQAWLFRAWRSGAALRFVPSVGVVLIPAGERAGSYARDSPDHAWMSQWMADDPRCRERVLEEAALNEAMARAAGVERPRLWALRRLGLGPIYRMLVRLDVHPASLVHLLKYGRRGNFVKYLRRYTAAE